MEKTKEIQQGQSVYRVIKEVVKYGLKEGERFYLDNFHRDHVEFFKQNGHFKRVLNLDGTEYIAKTMGGAGRRL